MKIIEPTKLPEIISAATTLESSIILLSNRVLELQKKYNESASEEEEINLIAIETESTPNEPYTTISLIDIKADFIEGNLKIDDPIAGTGENFVPNSSSTYPWKAGRTSLENLCNLMMFTFRLEKKSIYNPDEYEPMTLTLTQNTNINEPMFTLASTLELNINISRSGEDLRHSANEYLPGYISGDTIYTEAEYLSNID